MEKTPASHRNNYPPPPQAQPPQRVQLNENGGKSHSTSTSADVNNKSAADPSPHNLPHQPRPNIDIILSLKDPFYRSVMTKFYQSLGTRITKGPKVREKKMANEALLLFKSRKTTTLGGALVDTAAAETAKMIPVRFFKPVSRYEVNGTFVEVDEKAALKSKSVLLLTPRRRNFHLHRIKAHHLNLWFIIFSCQKFVMIWVEGWSPPTFG